MSVSYEAVIVVGLPYDEVNHNKEIANEEIMTCFSLWFDADRDNSILGYEYQSSGSYSAVEFDYDPRRIEELKQLFFTVTQQDANVYLCTHGT